MNKYLIILYFVTIPFYFFSSGIPQFSEFILCILFLINMIGLIKVISSKISTLYTPIFILMMLINVIYYYFTQSFESISYSLYYLFNWLVITLFIYLLYIDKNKYIRVLLLGCYLSGVLQFFLSLIYSSNSVRETLFFNNPNQLAYFSLLIVIIVVYCNNKLNGSIFINYSIMFIGLYLILLSASMSVLASLLLIVFIYLILNSRTILEKLLSWGLSIIILIFTYMIFINSKYLYNINGSLDTVLYRFNHNSNQSSSIFFERGYDRIIEFPKYILFGAGEGQLERFNTTIELHSTYGTLLFSYGIIGLLLFFILIFFIFFNVNFKYSYLLIAPLIYGITHYGLRESLFWIFLALLLYESFESIKNKKHQNNTKQL